MPTLKKPAPEINRLRALVRYDRDTGLLRWVMARKRCRPGDIAGCFRREDGHVYVGIDGKTYSVARIAWYLETGVWPEEIDHRDCDPANNKWTNLRLATPVQNQYNKRVRMDSKSGIKGVQRHQKGWRARIRIGGVVRRQLFPTVEQAVRAYKAWSSELHGEFGRSS